MAVTPLFGPGGQAGMRRKHRLGFPLSQRIKARFLRRGRGVFPPPHLRRNQRLMIPIPPLAGPRALEALGPGDTPFIKELKCTDFSITFGVPFQNAKLIRNVLFGRFAGCRSIRFFPTLQGPPRVFQSYNFHQRPLNWSDPELREIAGGFLFIKEVRQEEHHARPVGANDQGD